MYVCVLEYASTNISHCNWNASDVRACDVMSLVCMHVYTYVCIYVPGNTCPTHIEMSHVVCVHVCNVCHKKGLSNIPFQIIYNIHKYIDTYVHTYIHTKLITSQAHTFSPYAH